MPQKTFQPRLSITDFFILTKQVEEYGIEFVYIDKENLK
jgi:hypothetical protein